MNNLSVTHYLSAFKTRRNMQEKGITNPDPEIKKFTREFVEILSKLPKDNKIHLQDSSYFDSQGNLIAKLPALN